MVANLRDRCGISITRSARYVDSTAAPTWPVKKGESAGI